MIAWLKRTARRLAASDIVQRAAHTFWQAAAASVVATFAGADLNLASLADLSTDQKIVTSAVVAGLGAVFSLLKGAATASSTKVAPVSLLDVPDSPDPLADTPDPNTPGSSTPKTDESASVSGTATKEN